MSRFKFSPVSFSLGVFALWLPLKWERINSVGIENKNLIEKGQIIEVDTKNGKDTLVVIPLRASWCFANDVNFLRGEGLLPVKKNTAKFIEFNTSTR